MNDNYPLHFLSEKDYTLAGLIKSIGKYSIELHHDPFESLLKAIIYQQLSGKSANAIYKRFLNYYYGKVPQPKQIITTPDELFRIKIGLSYRKIEYIKDLSCRISTKRLDLSLLPTMSDEEIIAELIKVKGIGRWTAEMFLIFSLGRPDVLPVDDLGFRAGVRRHYGYAELPKAAELRALAEPWRPYRSFATWYLWR